MPYGNGVAPRLTVQAVEAFERAFQLRMPFKFGNTVNTHGRQAVIRLKIRLEDGREGWGYSAESLGAKWFDKNPALTDEQGLNQLRRSLRLAADAYLASGPRTAFGFFADHYEQQVSRCAKEGLLPLVSSYGPALLDRAILDALCKLLGVSFYTAIQRNLPGIGAHESIPDLAGFDFSGFLSRLTPAGTIEVRHTVGMVDPITATDQPPGTRINDGLPETLEEVISAYGHRYFKLKVGGHIASDIERLSAIAAVLDRTGRPYFVTIDGNEQYATAEAALEFWNAVVAEPRLARLRASTLFVEQPINRHEALRTPVDVFAAAKPLIIDESDGELDSFVRARSLGYSGVSSKVCKGFYKSIINKARCTIWNAVSGVDKYFMSAEDLTVHAGLSLQQDLVLVNLIGLTHVERNGHHFIDGFAERPETESEAFLQAHPDLYHRQNSRVRLKISDGRLAIGSLNCVGFGATAEPDFSTLEGMSF